jgi:hypothetical protein
MQDIAAPLEMTTPYIAQGECPTVPAALIQPIVYGASAEPNITGWVHPLPWRGARFWAATDGFRMHLLRSDHPLVERDELLFAPKVSQFGGGYATLVPALNDGKPISQRQHFGELLNSFAIKEGARLLYDSNLMALWASSRELSLHLATVLCAVEAGYQVAGFLPFGSGLLDGGEPHLMVSPYFLAQAVLWVQSLYPPTINMVGMSPDKQALFLGLRDHNGEVQRAAILRGLKGKVDAADRSPAPLV